ncbi:MAG: GNAT family N-acetyltransferase [Opitutaceae bacterium]|jgi:GNAT superfamily N-acetyltransferase
MIVRTMEPADVPSYCALFRRVFAQPPWSEEWSLDAIGKELGKTRARKGFIGLVAHDESDSAGFATGYRLRWLPAFYLEQLFVDDRRQKTGIGRALLLELFLRIDGLVILLTKQGSTAETFYIHNGFKRVLKVRFKGKILLYQWRRR